MFLSMGYALPLLQWLHRAVSAYSAPDCPTILEVRRLNQHLFQSCSPEDVIMPQGVALMHLTHILWDLSQGKTLANPFVTFQ
ncbi:hypothetical protein TNCV_454561 [Trichonephila clavipes]|nr:hypothetical protein TNCV_454561 [Trichonephila clavipes]